MCVWHLLEGGEEVDEGRLHPLRKLGRHRLPQLPAPPRPRQVSGACARALARAWIGAGDRLGASRGAAEGSRSGGRTGPAPPRLCSSGHRAGPGAHRGGRVRLRPLVSAPETGPEYGNLAILWAGLDRYPGGMQVRAGRDRSVGQLGSCRRAGRAMGHDYAGTQDGSAGRIPRLGPLDAAGCRRRERSGVGSAGRLPQGGRGLQDDPCEPTAAGRGGASGPHLKADAELRTTRRRASDARRHHFPPAAASTTRGGRRQARARRRFGALFRSGPGASGPEPAG